MTTTVAASTAKANAKVRYEQILHEFYASSNSDGLTSAEVLKLKKETANLQIRETGNALNQLPAEDRTFQHFLYRTLKSIWSDESQYLAGNKTTPM